MEIKVIERRIELREEKIIKLKRRIVSWEEMKDSEEAFRKEYSWIYNYETRKEEFKKEWEEKCDEEIARAKRNLEDAQNELVKYQNQLEAIKQFEQEEKIEVIWNFLIEWKENVKAFIREDAKNVAKCRAFNAQMCEKHNSGAYRNNKEQYALDEQEYRRLRSVPHALTWKVYNKKSQTLVDEEMLEKELQKDVEARYKKMVNQVSAITGKITDASRLTIGNSGDINGVIAGEKGKVRIETIGAGGYNIQVFHYRTLIHNLGGK